ncbi:MAG TPA: hypothetical protein P5150_03470, partial [Candidatus Ratteibacteria bacterium]|nr:hypothetical protein [Candidatus Ratteibacteria bacterium]
LPVSKFQFEKFMIKNGPLGYFYTDEWYKKILSLNKRNNWKKINENPWGIFITGLEYKEIVPFLKYLGKDFRLPTVEEWICLYKVTKELKEEKESLFKQCKKNCSFPALYWIKNDFYPLTEEGLVEIVKDEKGQIKHIGKPFNKWLPNLWQANTVRDIFEETKYLAGFRVAITDK